MQSLRVAHRVAARVASTQVRPATPALMRANANIAGGSMGRSWADKEHAAETQFFNKKDAELLAKLAGKLQNHTAPTDQSIAEEREALVAIFAKHNVTAPEALIDEVVKYKFNHH